MSDDAVRPLAGRVALVTGGSRGIGRGIAIALARAGADVGINYRRDEAAAKRTVSEIVAEGGRAEPFQASMGDLVEVDQLAKDVKERLGPVDLLVCNAGVASRGLPVAETESAEVERLLWTHALGAHRLINRLLPSLRAAARGDIVAISSAEVSAMRANGAPYNMAKAALEALTLTVAHEEASNGVRANIIAPGLVATDMGSRLVKAQLGLEEISVLDDRQPFGRICRPADIAAAVCFICSQGAEMLSAQRLVIDGAASSGFGDA